MGSYQVGSSAFTLSDLSRGLSRAGFYFSEITGGCVTNRIKEEEGQNLEDRLGGYHLNPG